MLPLSPNAQNRTTDRINEGTSGEKGSLPPSNDQLIVVMGSTGKIGYPTFLKLKEYFPGTVNLDVRLNLDSEVGQAVVEAGARLSKADYAKSKIPKAEEMSYLSKADLVVNCIGKPARSLSIDNEKVSRNDLYIFNSELMQAFCNLLICKSESKDTVYIIVANPGVQMLSCCVKYSCLPPYKFFAPGIALDAKRYASYLNELLGKKYPEEIFTIEPVVLGNHTADDMIFVRELTMIKDESVSSFLSSNRISIEEIEEVEKNAREEGTRKDSSGEGTSNDILQMTLGVFGSADSFIATGWCENLRQVDIRFPEGGFYFSLPFRRDEAGIVKEDMEKFQSYWMLMCESTKSNLLKVAKKSRLVSEEINLWNNFKRESNAGQKCNFKISEKKYIARDKFKEHQLIDMRARAQEIKERIELAIAEVKKVDRIVIKVEKIELIEVERKKEFEILHKQQCAVNLSIPDPNKNAPPQPGRVMQFFCKLKGKTKGKIRTINPADILTKTLLKKG